MSVARNVVFNPILAPGGGATEMAISVALQERAKTLPGVAGAPYKAIADALEVIPRTLIQNCGGNVIRTLTELRVSFFLPSHRDRTKADLSRQNTPLERACLV